MSAIENAIPEQIVSRIYSDERAMARYEYLSLREPNTLKSLCELVAKRFDNPSDQDRIIMSYLTSGSHELIYALKSINTSKMYDYYLIILEDYGTRAPELMEYMGVVCSSTNMLLEDVCSNPHRFSGSEEIDTVDTRLNRYIGTNIKKLLIPSIAYKDSNAKDIVDSIMKEQLQLIRECVGQAKKGCLSCHDCSPYCVFEKRFPGTGINRIK